MKNKESIIKISLSVFLLITALILTHTLLSGALFILKLIVFLPSYIIVGYEVLTKAVENIFKGELLDESFLMSVATIGALIMGDFPEATLVMLFFSAGELIEDYADEKSENSIKSLVEIRPDKARVAEGGLELQKDADSVNVGEIILVKAGERIALDGVITEGETSIDTSALTGESVPKSFGEGDSVLSGTVNVTSPVKIRVTATAENSTATKVIELVKSAREKKTKTEKFIRRFAKIYTPVVVALAVLMAVLPSLFNGEWSKNIYSALTFLVVSCPCALIISVPISFFGAVGCASRNGVLVKGSDNFDIISKLNTVVFDKTGTLTKGSFDVTAVHPEAVDKDDILRLAASVERQSNHPIARSVVSQYKNSDYYETQETTEVAGKGIIAKIKGRTVFVGNDLLMSENGIEYKNCHRTGTVVHIAMNNAYLGHIVISDAVKDNSKNCINELKLIGNKTVMLTGDNFETAKAVAKELDIDEFYASLMPEDKVSKIEEILNENGKTAFVGDGINDTPVLARADIGIAMGGLGSDSAIEIADAIIMDDDLSKIPILIKIAKKSVKIAKQNIVFSIAVKVSVLILSALGISGIMWLAAFADAGVLILAVLNALRTMKI